MTRDELKAMKVGDRVRWVSPGGSADGKVVERLRGGYFRIQWYDKHTEVINPRSGHDRERAKNIEVVKEAVENEHQAVSNANQKIQRPRCGSCDLPLDIWREPEIGIVLVCNNPRPMQTDDEFWSIWQNLPGDDIAKLERRIIRGPDANYGIISRVKKS